MSSFISRYSADIRSMSVRKALISNSCFNFISSINLSYFGIGLVWCKNVDSVNRHHPGEGVDACSELSDDLRSKKVIVGSKVFSSKPGVGLESWSELDSPLKF